MTDDRRLEIEHRFDGELDGQENLSSGTFKTMKIDSEARRHLDRLALLRELARRHDPASKIPRSTIARLVDDPASPLIVRVAAREQRARLFIVNREFESAIAMLRLAIEKDSVEYARVRTALTLAEFLTEPVEDAEDDPKFVRNADFAGACKVLKDLLPTIGRRDLAHQVRKAAEKYQAGSGAISNVNEN